MNYKFSSFDKKNTIQLTQIELEKYPFSLFAQKVKDGKNHENHIYETLLDGESLRKVKNFYQTGFWPDPYIASSKLFVIGYDFNFEEACEYLGLPSDQITEDDEEEFSFLDDCTEEEIQEMKQAQKRERRELIRLEEEKEFEREMEREDQLSFDRDYENGAYYYDDSDLEI